MRLLLLWLLNAVALLLLGDAPECPTPLAELAAGMAAAAMGASIKASHGWTRQIFHAPRNPAKASKANKGNTNHGNADASFASERQRVFRGSHSCQ